MPNKALRILIADGQHFHRLKIERLFNHLGYYRIAPVPTQDELLTLVEFGCGPFDLVVVDAAFADGELDVPGFFIDNPQIHHTLLFNCPPVMKKAARKNLHISHAALPDLAGIQALMKVVDPGLRSSELSILSGRSYVSPVRESQRSRFV
ncbi:hypothetical protein ACQKP5_25510 [Pseudomonas vancouverensis]|uniref:hypothetical protein n=1 Tax=Pseudomonas vancouverensis TaxID=95300 RepID=UPI003D02E59A